MILVGIDAGGSSCRCRIVNTRDKSHGEGRSGPANLRIGADKALAAARSAFLEALSMSGLTEGDMQDSCAVIGMAGIDRAGGKDPFSADVLGVGKLGFSSDAAIANMGSHGGEDGGTIIVGTGSIAVLRLGSKWTRIGGHGFPVSDEGSGAKIGLMALSSMLAWRDGLAAQSPLVEELFSKFGETTGGAYTWIDKATPTDFGTLAPLVVSHAEKGDVNATEIMSTAAAAIAQFIERLSELGAPRISLQGGLAPIISPWIEERSRIKLAPALGGPLDGAILSADILSRA